jgi:hypothetical protein
MITREEYDKFVAFWNTLENTAERYRGLETVLSTGKESFGHRGLENIILDEGELTVVFDTSHCGCCTNYEYVELPLEYALDPSKLDDLKEEYLEIFSDKAERDRKEKEAKKKAAATKKRNKEKAAKEKEKAEYLRLKSKYEGASKK